jgi:ABC-2 type transport system ATP-binding protein
MTGSCVIEAKGLRKSFGDVTVLESVDLRVERGTMLALLGPNGAGKTTTVRILSTLLRADGGTVTVNGLDVNTQARKIRETIGLTGQDTAVDELLTGRENLVMMARLFRLTPASADRRAAELLEQFDLVGAADRPAGTYSGGMRRRLDLAVSLINSPPVLFLDEPTTGLDPTSRLTMWDTIRELMAAGTTVLLTTQYMEEADQLANRIAVIDGGRVVAEGTAQELKSQVGGQRVELVVADVERAVTVLGARRVDERTVSLPVHGSEDLRQTLNRAADAGIEVRHVALHQSTLDDVFRAVTTRPVQTLGATR